MAERTYIAIDLKSFYASVECRVRGLDPLDTNLVVADESRTDKTICLAVTPSLKSFGIPGRERLFIVKEKVKEVNAARARRLGHALRGESASAKELEENPNLAVAFHIAVPQMALYMEVSARIYSIYLKYVAPEDIHVYSIDEVFMDVTDYLASSGMDAHTLAMTVILDVLKETGITATAGIGPNLYLAKVAMDIMAKHIKADENGVRIASLSVREYREKLWDHEPLTDFWRVGRGIAKRLAPYGIHTMGDIALQSIRDEELLYTLFGVNAELLIDHAWGLEPCLMEDIKAYRPQSSSLGQGQVLMEPYSFTKARLVLFEMADMLALSLLEKGLVCRQIVINVGFDRENLDRGYRGQVHSDHYGRSVPQGVHGSRNLETPSCLASELTQAALSLYDSIVDPTLLVRRLNITATGLLSSEDAAKEDRAKQLDLFEDYSRMKEEEEKLSLAREKELKLQKAALEIKTRFGKNSILRLSSFEEGATARERNRQIGGHKA